MSEHSKTRAMLFGGLLGLGLVIGWACNPAGDQPTSQPKTEFWHRIGEGRGYGTWRAKAPGGWLVKASHSSGLAMAFISDPKHEWVIK